MENYIPSENYKTLLKLVDERDIIKEQAESAEKKVRDFSENLGLQGVYNCTKAEEILKKLKNKEVQSLYPEVDIDAALDDLILKSIEDDFNVDDFIKQYLNKVTNG